MKSGVKKGLALLLAVLIFTGCFAVGFASDDNIFYKDSKFSELTSDQLNAKFKSGDKFIVYLYATECIYSKNIGANILKTWMDVYGKTIYGTCCNDLLEKANPSGTESSFSLPSWVWDLVEPDEHDTSIKAFKTPAVLFVENKSVKYKSFGFDDKTTYDFLMKTFRSFYGITDSTPKSIKVKSYPTKTVYGIGEEFDPTGFSLEVTYSDGKVLPVYSDFSFSGFDSANEAELTVAVLYAGLSATFKVKVSKTAEYSFDLQYHQTEARKMVADLNALRTGGKAWYWDLKQAGVDTAGIQLYEQYRKELGKLGKLEYDYNLERIAMQRAAEICVDYRVEKEGTKVVHRRPNGTSYTTLFVGYAGHFYENIARSESGIFNEPICFEGWLEEAEDYNGQGHRRSMLASDATAIGMACTELDGKYFWVMSLAVMNLDKTPVAAFDSVKRVSVEVLNTSIEKSETVLTPDFIKMDKDETVNLPSVRTDITMGCTPKLTIDTIPSYTFTSSNPDIVKVVGNKVKGIKNGTAELVTYIAGKRVKCDVIVGDACLHDVEEFKGYPATCTTAGLSDGKQCKLCKEWLVPRTEIKPLGHDKLYHEAKPATCTEAGYYEYYTCKRAGCDYTTYKVQKKLDHTPGTPAYENIKTSCDVDGTYDVVTRCTVCKEIISSTTNALAAGEHLAGEAVKENEVKPTCTTAGSYDMVKRCIICKAPVETVPYTVKALDHDFNNYRYNNDATVESDGTKTSKCSHCNETKTITAPGTKIVPAVTFKSGNVDYRNIVTLRATCSNLPANYKLAVYGSGTTPLATGSNTSVEYSVGEMKDNATYTVKVLNGSGEVVGGTSVSATVSVNKGFFKKLVAFFKGLFGSLPKVTVGDK